MQLHLSPHNVALAEIEKESTIMSKPTAKPNRIF